MSSFLKVNSLQSGSAGLRAAEQGVGGRGPLCTHDHMSLARVSVDSCLGHRGQLLFTDRDGISDLKKARAGKRL